MTHNLALLFFLKTLLSTSTDQSLTWLERQTKMMDDKDRLIVTANLHEASRFPINEN